jgi:hypothetical protein
VDLGNDDDPEGAPDPLDAPALVAGATQALTWSWEDRAVAGTHNVEVCADVADDIEEANEENNCKEQTFTVSAGGAAADAPRRVAGVRVVSPELSWGRILERLLGPLIEIIP